MTTRAGLPMSVGLVLSVSGLAVLLSGCDASPSSTPPLPSMTTSATPAPTSTPDPTAVSDPMTDVKANVDTFGTTGDNTPIVSHQGVGPGTVPLPQLAPNSNYYALINCLPAGKFKIGTRSFFAGTCAPNKGGFAGFPTKLLDSTIKVEVAASTKYWLVLVEKGEQL